MKNPDRTTLAKAFVAGREDLQPIPVLVHILRAFLKSEMDLDLRPVIDAVEREPTIAAKVIAHAQSAACRRLTPATSVTDAINRLGLQNAKRVIMTLALKEAYEFSRCPAFEVKRFMIETVRVAHIASIVGQPIAALKTGEDELTAIVTSGWYCIGLLHSIGLLHMVEREPDGMNYLLNQDDHLIAAERTMLGFDHHDVGGVLLAMWGLPGVFHIALPHLDDPAYRGEMWVVAAVIDLARCLAPLVTDGEDGEQANIDDDLISEVTEAWSERWGIALPAPLSLCMTGMSEATSLMEAVL